MIVLKFDEIREEIVNNLRRHMLIPIIGSGFTCGCKSLCGKVPSGKQYREYMINMIVSQGKVPNDELKALSLEPFPIISDFYHHIIPETYQREYLKNNFSSVSIEENKKKFLSISWPYVYTLNIDDGIEYNSRYKTVVYANRKVQKSIFDEKNCVIKLHGDITDLLTYTDSQSEIFDRKQYAISLQTNTSLLSKLTHDYKYQNLVYIGCSLSDEIDLLSLPSDKDFVSNARYYCTVDEPTYLEKIKLRSYGITHCLIFDSHEKIYDSFWDVACEAEKIRLDEVDSFKSFSFNNLSADFELNKSYLFHGKSLINKDRTITLPYFFISRDIISKVIENLKLSSIQLLVGSGCSGKTYAAIDLALHIRDRDIFIFESKDRLSNAALNLLLKKNNSIIIADNAALNIQQIEYLIKSKKILDERGINIVIIASKNNRDLSGMINLLILNGTIDYNEIPQVEIPNKFSKNELKILNQRLVTTTLGVFSAEKTIIDNIIDTSQKLIATNKYDNIKPKFNELREVACLVALATERKIYSYRAIELDFISEINIQQKSTTPLIEVESTWAFEKSASDNSPLKYVINAEYWLNSQLSEFAKNSQNHMLIIDAYRYIISNLIENYGKPDLMYGNKYAPYKTYILFDNINQIFGFKGLLLIRKIYESLNDLLASDPNYMHQRSKCLIKSSCIERDATVKQEFLEKAYRDAAVARAVFEKRYEDTANEKLPISIAHTMYTETLALCHACSLDGYRNVVKNTNAIQLLYKALQSPYNSYDFAKTDTYNYGNVILMLITNLIANKSLVDDSAYSLLENLFKVISEH